MADTPQTLAEFIEAVRAGLVCDRCERYVGSLAPKRYLPAPYPVALGLIPATREAEALIAFEWHMLGLLRQGKFTIRHPQRDGTCVTLREWAHDDGELPDDEDPLDDESDLVGARPVSPSPEEAELDAGA